MGEGLSARVGRCGAETQGFKRIAIERRETDQSDDLHESPKGEDDSEKHLGSCIAGMRQRQISIVVGKELNATIRPQK